MILKNTPILPLWEVEKNVKNSIATTNMWKLQRQIMWKTAKIATSFFAATLRRRRGLEKLQTEGKLTGRFFIWWWFWYYCYYELKRVVKSWHYQMRGNWLAGFLYDDDDGNFDINERC